MAATDQYIIKQLFRFLDDDDDSPIDLRQYEKYIAFYEQEIWGLGSGCAPTVLLEVINTMKGNPTITREQIFAKLKEDHAYIDSLDLQDTIDCAIRVWLMINSRSDRPDGTLSDGSVEQRWEDGQRLCDFVYGLFYPGKTAPGGVSNAQVHYSEDLLAGMTKESDEIQTRLTHPLTAINLKRYSKVKICWAQYLPEHLEFHHNYRALLVFRHKRWLIDMVALLEKWEKTQGGQIPAVPVFPPFPVPLEVLKEALMSLDYLLPPEEKPTQRFLRKKINRYFDQSGRQPGPNPRLERFRYYHGRLVEVAQELINPLRNWRTIWPVLDVLARIDHLVDGFCFWRASKRSSRLPDPRQGSDTVDRFSIPYDKAG